MDNNAFQGSGPPPYAEQTWEQSMKGSTQSAPNTFTPLIRNFTEARQIEAQYLARRDEDTLAAVPDAPKNEQERVGLVQELVEAMTSSDTAVDAFRTTKKGLEPTLALVFTNSLKNIELQIVAWKLLKTTLVAQTGQYSMPSWGKSKIQPARYLSFRARFDDVLEALRQSKSLTKNLFDTEPTWIKRIAINPEREKSRKATNEKTNKRRDEQVKYAVKHMSKEEPSQHESPSGSMPSKRKATGLEDDHSGPAKRFQVQRHGPSASVSSFGNTTAPGTSSAPGFYRDDAPVESSLDTSAARMGPWQNQQEPRLFSNASQAPRIQRGPGQGGNSSVSLFSQTNRPLRPAPAYSSGGAQLSTTAFPSRPSQASNSFSLSHPPAEPSFALPSSRTTEQLLPSSFGDHTQQLQAREDVTEEWFGSLVEDPWVGQNQASQAVPENPSGSTSFPVTSVGQQLDSTQTLPAETEQTNASDTNPHLADPGDFDAALDALVANSQSYLDDSFD